jgi:hypothetical protein
MPTLERQAFVNGLFQELRAQSERHLGLIGQLLKLQGQVQVSERALRLTRDHLEMLMSQGQEEDVPKDWKNNNTSQNT